jgi:hypothetical protein
VVTAAGEPGGRVLVVVSYFADDSEYPRSGARAHRAMTYWSNIAANVATLRHVAGTDVEPVVFAGDEPPPGPAAVLDRAGVEIRHHPFDHRPPAGFYTRYAGTLYLLDAMTALAAEVAPDDVLLFVDPDIVWVTAPEPLVAEVRRGGIVAYDLLVPDTVPLCDHTRRDQTEIMRAMTGRGPGAAEPAISHFGGELYGMLGAELVTLVPELDVLWEANLRRVEQGLPHHHLEEHILNVALWAREEQEGRANAHIQRIRTLPRPFGTRERARQPLVAWHLPMEKTTGLRAVYLHVAGGRPLPPVGPAYQRWLAARTGVRPAGLRWAGDRARQLKWVVTGKAFGGTPNHGL